MSGIPASVGDVKLDADNVFTGLNTFDKLPISSATPTNSNQLVTKTFIDSKCAILTAGTQAIPQTFSGFNEFQGDVEVKADMEFPDDGDRIVMSGDSQQIYMSGNSSLMRQSDGDFQQIGNTCRFVTDGKIAQNVFMNSMSNPVEFAPAGSPSVSNGGFIVFDSGNVGIGTSNDNGGRLMVYGEGGGFQTGMYRMFRVLNGGTHTQSGVNQVGHNNGGAGTQGGAVGIYSNQRIYADRGLWSQQGALVASDIRIKNNFEDLQEGECIEKLKKLRPLKYGYKDVVDKGTGKIYGFIAQEVKNVLPESVGYQNHYIPDIYKGCDVSGDILKIDDYDVRDLSINTELRLIDDYDREDFIKVVDIDVSNNSVKIDKNLTEDKKFCYGRSVDDFHFLEKDHIWTITTASVIELIKRVETLEAKINKI